jgi:glutamate dehydrogenase/leucine dehydrogenase
MTLKNAAAGIPHGGGKAVIMADPGMAPAEKDRLIRAFARAIAELGGYVPGPDMGTDESCMAGIRDEIGRAVGLPRVLGGIPLDEIGITGYGVAIAAEAAEDFCDVRLEGARVSIQGFGAVGRHAARHLAARGARVVAVSDTGGTVQDQAGLPLEDLDALKAGGRSVADLPGAAVTPAADAITADCDILVPAARPDAITAANVAAVRARLILEGANIPASAGVERALHERGVLVVPDFIANAGGVICAAVEYHGGTEATARDAVATRIRENTREVLDRARRTGGLPRDAATLMARARLDEAMGYRRFR